jgi:hypothetical protein
MRPQPFDAPFCPAPGLDPTNLNRSGLLRCDVALRARRSCPFKSRPCAPLDAVRPRVLICAQVRTWDSSARCRASSGGTARVHSRRRLIWTRTAADPLFRHRADRAGCRLARYRPARKPAAKRISTAVFPSRISPFFINSNACARVSVSSVMNSSASRRLSPRVSPVAMNP